MREELNRDALTTSFFLLYTHFWSLHRDYAAVEPETDFIIIILMHLGKSRLSSSSKFPTTSNEGSLQTFLSAIKEYEDNNSQRGSNDALLLDIMWNKTGFMY